MFLSLFVRCCDISNLFPFLSCFPLYCIVLLLFLLALKLHRPDSEAHHVGHMLYNYKYM